jgi:hypothetical protein
MNGTFKVEHTIEVWNDAPRYGDEVDLTDSTHQALCELVCHSGWGIIAQYRRIRAWIWLKQNTNGCYW